MCLSIAWLFIDCDRLLLCCQYLQIQAPTNADLCQSASAGGAAAGGESQTVSSSIIVLEMFRCYWLHTVLHVVVKYKIM